MQRFEELGLRSSAAVFIGSCDAIKGREILARDGNAEKPFEDDGSCEVDNERVRRSLPSQLPEQPNAQLEE